jgi:surface carbohydrate biosynthesis protein
MRHKKPKTESVVLLVDNKRRDLDVAALIAAHIERRGVRVHLEPLEAYRAVLDAHRPGMIIFNHLNASHVAAYSHRLHRMGVKTAVLLNEGIAYDPEVRRYLVEKRRSDNVVDIYFAWNAPHRQALMALAGENTAVELIGVPRFDFYREPYVACIKGAALFPDNGKQNVLFCTNFVTAQMKDWSAERVDRFFVDWAHWIPRYKNYRTSIDAHFRARQRFTEFVETLAQTDRYNILARPHPNEIHTFYRDWIDRSTQARNIILDTSSPIAQLILESDLHIACETCTTALEAWICGKPTISLAFDRDPLFWEAVQCDLNIACDTPSKLPSMVEAGLRDPVPKALTDKRAAHLEMWCGPQDGRAAERLADIAVQAIEQKAPADWSQLNWVDKRRAAKLRTMQSLGEAYHFQLNFPLKRIFGGKNSWKLAAYEKAIKPSDVTQAVRKMEALQTKP